jgi:hypothetical protein
MSEAAPTAQARALAAAGRWREAERVIATLVAEQFGLDIAAVRINRDRYSLNSLNGAVTLAGGGAYFFKFHQEEDEGETVAEYYRAEVLRRAGYRIDVPTHASGTVGRQILLYRKRSDPRLVDVCRAMELAADFSGAERIIALQAESDRRVGALYRASLHAATAEQVAGEPIHRLFHARLIDADAPGRLGGRVARFYAGRQFAFPGLSLDWEELKDLRWRINGIDYPATLGQLFDDSRRRLAPDRLGAQGAVIAHGDAHNANIWVAPDGLTMFDPAFAGEHVPALLAEIKPTFHNIFAHPFWLYDAGIAAERLNARASRDGKVLAIEHDWRLSPLRRTFLDGKARALWAPLLEALARRGWLPEDWRRILRLALFCCPTLVMDLRAGGLSGHNPISSAIGLATAISVGAEPQGEDDVTRFLDAISPGTATTNTAATATAAGKLSDSRPLETRA